MNGYKAGKHTLKIDKVADGLEIEGFALVTEPLDMEGEKRN